MKSINKLLVHLFNNPLSVLRFALPWLVVKVIFGQLNSIYNHAYEQAPEYSKTWMLQLMPDSWLVFDPESKFLIIAVVICAIGASFGIAGRLCLFLLAGIEFLIGGTYEAFGFFDHNTSLSSQVLLVLALVPGSMRISIDYFIYNKWIKKKATPVPTGPTPKWGLNLILILMVVTYFSAGVSKIRHGGFEWLDGATLGFYLQNYVADYPVGSRQLLIVNDNGEGTEYWKDTLGFEGYTYGNYQYRPGLRKITDWVASKPAIVIGLSVMTILFELIGFIVFINNKYRNLFILSAFITHTLIGVLMGLSFDHYRLILLCLFDWKLILNSFGGSYGKQLAAQVFAP